MITRLDRNKLHGEMEALLDEAAEESRLQNITPRQLTNIIDLIHKKHIECIRAVDDDGHDPDEVIRAYRVVIRKVLKKF